MNIRRAVSKLLPLVLALAWPALLQAQVAGGWFVRVCRVDSPPLHLKLSVPDEAGNLKDWRQWRPGDGYQVQLPIEYRYADEITVWGYAQNRQVDMCVIYNDGVSEHSTRQMSFDRDEWHNLKMNDHGSCGC